MTASRIGIFLRLAAFLVAAFFVYRQNKKTKQRLQDEDDIDINNDN